MPFPMFYRRGRRLASSGDHDIGHPNTTCDLYNKLLLIPDGDAGSLDKNSSLEKMFLA
jgi:hypothetical protein